MKILFVYNDYNDVRGISTVMGVAERYAFSLGESEITSVNSKNPMIVLKDGSEIEIAPVSKTFTGFENYDKVFIDSTISTFMEVSHFGNKIDFYNKDSFKG